MKHFYAIKLTAIYLLLYLVLPNSALSQTPGGVNNVPIGGVAFELYQGYDDTPENGITGTLKSTGFIHNLDNIANIFEDEIADQFSLILTARILVITPGDYTFRVNNVDDDAAIFVNGTIILTADCCGTFNSNAVNLTVGYHDIEVRFSENGGGHVIDVEWDLPGGGFNFVEIPDNQLSQPNGSYFATWHKADYGITAADGAVLNNWNDASSNGNNLDLEVGSPTYYNSSVSQLFNFNPTVDFNDHQMRSGDDTRGLAWGRQYRSAFVVSSNAAPGDEVMTGYGRDANNLNFRVGTSGHYLSFGSNGNMQTGTVGQLNTTGVYITTANFTGNGIFGRINGRNDLSAPISGIYTSFNDFEDFGIGLAPDMPLGNGYNGRIAEVIHFPYSLGTTEFNRIESYLAVKYGITLDQSTATDYSSSGGVTTWDASSNVGYDNDIFGIGRDDATALNQKISKSSNQDAIIIAALDNDFTSSNIAASRTTTHSNNNQFLMFSNDNGATTTNQTTELPYTYVDSRMTREWKVSATNFSQSVNLKFQGYPTTATVVYYLVKDDNGDFTSGYTIVGELDSNGEITGVSLNNGEYITLFRANIVPGTPGGTSPELWLKGNAGVTTVSGNVSAWADQSNSNNATQGTAGDRPEYITSGNRLINYNRSLDFNSDFLRLDNAFGSGDYSYNMYGVAQNGAGLLISQGQSLVFNNDIRLWSVANNNLTDQQTFLGVDITSSRPTATNSRYFFNAWYNAHLSQKQVSVDNGFHVSTGASGFDLESRQPYIGGNEAGDRYSGQASEIFTYSRPISDKEKIKVGTYLAVKYGITLDNSSGGEQGDYTSFNGSVFWDASNAPNYHNNVIGIGRDNNSTLDQKQSRTASDTLRLYIGSLANSNTDNGGTITNDVSFMTIGDNLAPICTTPSANAELPPVAACSTYRRIAREWKATKFNFDNVVNIEIKLNQCANPGAVTNTDLVLLVDDDGNFSNGGTTCYSNGDGTGIVIDYSQPFIILRNLNGTHFANNSTAFFTIATINMSTPLPILLKEYNVTNEGCSNMITWSTISETSNDYFTIERSLDLESWVAIGKIKGAGNSTEETEYSFRDHYGLLDDYIYYRLTQVDLNGKKTDLGMRSVKSKCGDDRIDLFPNPGSHSVTLMSASAGQLNVRDNLGRTIFSKAINEGETTIDVSNFESGVYLFVVSFDSDQEKTIRFVKN